MNIRILAAFAVIVMSVGVSAQAADESFESQLQEVAVMTVNPEVTLATVEAYPANAVALEPSKVIVVQRAGFRDLICRKCFRIALPDGTRKIGGPFRQ